MTKRLSGWGIIRPAGWALAALMYVVVCLLLAELAIPHDPKMREWPLLGKALFAGLIPIFAAGLVLLWSYIYADSKRRGMRSVVWILLAIFVPNMVGVILYFLFREPLVASCPSCGEPARENFAYCPKCGAVLSPACAKCHREVKPEWTNCAWCGAKLEGRPASTWSAKAQPESPG